MTWLDEDDLSLLPIGDAAAIAGVRPATVRKWISRYDLPTFREGGAVFVSEAAVLDCEFERRSDGRGRKRAP